MMELYNDESTIPTKRLPLGKQLKLAFGTARSRINIVKQNDRCDDNENSPRREISSITNDDRNVIERRDESETLNEGTTSVRRYANTREVIDDEVEYANMWDFALYPIASLTLNRLTKSQYIPKDIWEASKVGNSIAVHRFIMKDPFLAVHPSDNDRTPLFLAAHGGHLHTCKILLDNGASDPNEECRLGALNKNIAKLIESRALISLSTTKMQILTVNSSADESDNQEKMNDNWWCDRIYGLICF